MTALRKPAWGSFAPLRQKLLSLGLEDETGLNAILGSIRLGSRVGRGDDISIGDSSLRHWTVLIDGVACLYDQLVDGGRQIYSFQYPGDFCDLSPHVLASASGAPVAAVTNCSIGFIEKSVLDRMIAQYPALASALWRSTAIEANVLRVRLLSSRQPALQRVAHLLCEQLARQADAGIRASIIPMGQIDVADAVGLSIVHVSRTFKELQTLGLLEKVGRSMKVVDREGLACLANFDGSYLYVPEPMAGWELKFPQP